MSSIRIESWGIRVEGLEVARPDVADYVRTFSENERSAVVSHAIEVGVFCLERASTSLDLDFVRRRVDSLLAEVEKTTLAIPEKIAVALSSRLGTEDGQVLAPISRLVDSVTSALTERVDSLRTLLAEEIDPSSNSSTLGKALTSLQALLDPKRTDSVQATTIAAVNAVGAADGQVTRSLKGAVLEAIAPLATEVDRLAKEFRGNQAAREALAQTTAKGFDFEDEVTAMLQGWAAASGARVMHVGGDNQPGDIIVSLPSDRPGGPATTIVIEAKSRCSAVGRKVITEALSRALERRGGDAAIYVSDSLAGLGREIGDWAEGQCGTSPFVATSREHLITAVRFCLAQLRITAIKEATADADLTSVSAQLTRMRTSLRRITNVNRQVTHIRTCASNIQDEGETLREEIREALLEIEAALRIVVDKSDGAVVADVS